MKKIKISLDAMGGDYAPEIVVEGAAEAKVRYPDLEFIFFGNKKILDPFIEWSPFKPFAISWRNSETVSNSNLSISNINLLANSVPEFKHSFFSSWALLIAKRVCSSTV